MTTLNPTTMQDHAFGNLLGGAVAGFIVALMVGLGAMTLSPIAALPAFLITWAVAGIVFSRRLTAFRSGSYWGEDFGSIRNVRRWD